MLPGEGDAAEEEEEADVTDSKKGRRGNEGFGGKRVGGPSLDDASSSSSSDSQLATAWDSLLDPPLLLLRRVDEQQEALSITVFFSFYIRRTYVCPCGRQTGEDLLTNSPDPFRNRASQATEIIPNFQARLFWVFLFGRKGALVVLDNKLMTKAAEQSSFCSAASPPIGSFPPPHWAQETRTGPCSKTCGIDMILRFEKQVAGSELYPILK